MSDTDLTVQVLLVDGPMDRRTFPAAKAPRVLYLSERSLVGLVDLERLVPYCPLTDGEQQIHVYLELPEHRGTEFGYAPYQFLRTETHQTGRSSVRYLTEGVPS